jgi:hypothetical protein
MLLVYALTCTRGCAVAMIDESPKLIVAQKLVDAGVYKA